MENGSVNPASSFSQIFADELCALAPHETVPDGVAAPVHGTESRINPQTQWVDQRGAPLAALCLSGGGIRSASFALGALQALAKAGVLPRFHYLSTVSGGGYIGAWLSAFRHYAKSDTAVVAALSGLTADGTEVPQIAGIRANSNYITPRFGLFSADTWAVLAQYFRNLLLNWMVFGPLFLSVLVWPRWCARTLADLAADPWYWREIFLFLGGAMLSLGLTISTTGRLRSSGPWLTDKWYLIGVLGPVVASAMALTGAARIPDLNGASGPILTWWQASLTMAATYAIAGFGGWVINRCLPGRVVDRGRFAAPKRPLRASESLAWIFCGAVVGVLIWFGFYLSIALRALGLPETKTWFGPINLSDVDAIMVIAGNTWIVLSVMTGDLIFTGLTSFQTRGDMDQEWMARSGGWMAAAAFSWAIFAAVVLYGPSLLGLAWGPLAAAGTGGVSGVIALLGGASARSAVNGVRQIAGRLSFPRLISGAAVVFTVVLATGLSALDAAIADALTAWAGRLIGRGPNTPGIGIMVWLAMAAGFAGLALGLSLFVNINRFSLHAIYRNRLIRAFLGAARGSARQEQDPFTGFDPADNLHMTDLAPARDPSDIHPIRLLHVINLTLNVVATRKLAWQERKAEAFSVTPFACGNRETGYRATGQYGGPAGLSLGTATAISGAAVSPNQGYHSSPLVGLLLMLFNLRLGWWLGNPRDAKAARGQGPRIGLWPALRELAGMTNDTGGYVYLSDGGHFENLGIYEMVRRRCRMIVVSDAGCDPETKYEDLANAVRKCYIDFGVRITFREVNLPARPDMPFHGAYAAVGRIAYPNGPDGWLLYVKPAVHGTEAMSVRGFALTNKDFPHESTANQWFSESRLEAYRSLGEHIFGQICGDGPPQDTAPDDMLAWFRHQADHYAMPGRHQAGR